MYNKVYKNSKIDCLFIVCFKEHYEVRLFCIEDTYSLGKREYIGRINGLDLLSNK